MIRNPEGLRIGKEGNRLSRIHFADTNKMTMFGHKKKPIEFRGAINRSSPGLYIIMF